MLIRKPINHDLVPSLCKWAIIILAVDRFIVTAKLIKGIHIQRVTRPMFRSSYVQLSLINIFSLDLCRMSRNLRQPTHAYLCMTLRLRRIFLDNNTNKSAPFFFVSDSCLFGTWEPFCCCCCFQQLISYANNVVTF